MDVHQLPTCFSEKTKDLHFMFSTNMSQYFLVGEGPPRRRKRGREHSHPVEFELKSRAQKASV